MGLFNPSSWFKAPGMDMGPVTGLYNQRQSQINEFSNRLSDYENQYRNSLANMYQNAWNNFVPGAAAQYGAAGLGTNGGAFAAELARQAANYQAQMAPAVAQFGANSAGMIDNARAGAYNPMMQAQFGAQSQQYGRQGEIDAGLGNLAFQGVMAATGAGLGMGGTPPPPGFMGPAGKTGFGTQFGNLFMGQYGMGPLGNPFRNQLSLNSGYGGR